MLLITRLPSLTMLGIEAKLLSSMMILLALLVASAPLAIAIEQSDSLNAKISFTPSPVMATFLPDLRMALIRRHFCSGVTLPKTLYFVAQFSTSSSVMFSSEMHLS